MFASPDFGSIWLAALLSAASAQLVVGRVGCLVGWPCSLFGWLMAGFAMLVWQAVGCLLAFRAFGCLLANKYLTVSGPLAFRRHSPLALMQCAMEIKVVYTVEHHICSFLYTPHL
ncbi:hypothetical protein BDR06DRAFT_634419 [Suillus hirtellus]|nr:hypothetical protein BDR06DRAFT_634419 [Suillus hirtellus]